MESTRTLGRQRVEGKGDAITLGRARDSFLNISMCLSPEILGYIFKFSITQKRSDLSFIDTTFNGLERGSYNFLFVCRRWYDVAINTPELWSFWGNTLRDWDKMCRRNKAAAVDLVLNRDPSGPGVLSIPLRGELRDRIARDEIRRIHLRSDDYDLLGSILSSLTPDGEGVQEKCIESIIFHTEVIPEELSDFFARSHLPRLQCLKIAGAIRTPLLDQLASKTTRLTTLSLKPGQSSIPLTTPLLNSILVANPNLQHLELLDGSLPSDVNESGVRVPLCYLRTISLSGDFHSALRLLRRLEFPAPLEYTKLNMKKATLKDVRQMFGPYVKGLFQHKVWSQDGLEVINNVCSDLDIYVACRAGYPGETLKPGLVFPSARFSVTVTGSPTRLELKKLSLDLMAFLPHKHVQFLHMQHTPGASEEFLATMSKVTSLWLETVTVSDGFLQLDPSRPHPGQEFLPALESLNLISVDAEDDNWQPLINYLVDKNSDGKAVWLSMTSRFRVPPEVIRKIKGLVKGLDHTIDPHSIHCDRGLGVLFVEC